MLPVAAQAAPVLSRADAEAITISVAGNAQGSGRVEATYDGGAESVSGNPAPAIPTGGFLSAGVLTQQASAGNGFSAACAGVAGRGGGTVQLGDGSCLTPGDNVNSSLTDLGLEGLLQAPGGEESLPPQLAELVGGLGEGADQLDGIIETAVGSLDDQVGPLGLQLSFDAVEGGAGSTTAPPRDPPAWRTARSCCRVAERRSLSSTCRRTLHPTARC